ncbi:MAG: hypothetical protein KGJ78_05280 [Alphaproteobacteria bacterium]|nr:hypothetical protein [Alphaproteobacteria bacterium]
MGRSVVAAVVAAVVLLAASAGFARQASAPMAPAADVVAGRTTAAVVRVVYDITPVAKDIPSQISADIGPDYVFVRRVFGGSKPPQTDLYDYRLRRVISIDEAHHTFVNRSLYAMVDFRYVESFNRRGLRGMLGAAGLGKSGTDISSPYWDQQELGIVSPEDASVSADRKATPGGGVQFTVDGLNGGRFEPSAQSLSPVEMQGFTHFLRENATLHPLLVSAIAAGGKIPSEISLLVGHFSDRKAQTWHLVSAERLSASFPLSPDDTPVIIDDVNPLAEPLRSLLPTMMEAVASRYNGGPRSIADYRAALAKAFADGHILQHFLLDNEFQLQYGLGSMACLNGNPRHDDCSQQQDIVAKWKTDPSTMVLIEAFGLEQRDPKAAIEKRGSVPRDGLSNAYMIDLWNGDTMLQHGNLDGAATEIAKAIRGNPYVGGFYKDLGDVFGRSFEPVEEWLCYDLARALPGAGDMLVVDGIGKKEKYLEAKFPEFF